MAGARDRLEPGVRELVGEPLREQPAAPAGRRRRRRAASARRSRPGASRRTAPARRPAPRPRTGSCWSYERTVIARGQLPDVVRRVRREPHPRLLLGGPGEVTPFDQRLLLGEARLRVSPTTPSRRDRERRGRACRRAPAARPASSSATRPPNEQPTTAAGPSSSAGGERRRSRRSAARARASPKPGRSGATGSWPAAASASTCGAHMRRSAIPAWRSSDVHSSAKSGRSSSSNAAWSQLATTAGVTARTEAVRGNPHRERDLAEGVARPQDPALAEPLLAHVQHPREDDVEAIAGIALAHDRLRRARPPHARAAQRASTGARRAGRRAGRRGSARGRWRARGAARAVP